MRRVLLVALLALSACPSGVEVEDQTFPCRAAGDCVEGYECHPTRFVCVVAGSVSAAASDAGAGD